MSNPLLDFHKQQVAQKALGGSGQQLGIKKRKSSK